MPKSNEYNVDNRYKQKDIILSQDMTEMDLELESIGCPRCSKSFKNSNQLFIHMRSEHNNPTTCHICNKDLKCMANILSHHYVHLKLKPYSCPKCKYATRTRFNLKVHIGSCCDIKKFKYERGNSKRKNKSRNKSKKLINSGIINGTQYYSHNTNNIFAPNDLIHMIPDLGINTNNDNKPINFKTIIQVYLKDIPPSNNNIPINIPINQQSMIYSINNHVNTHELPPNIQM